MRSSPFLPCLVVAALVVVCGRVPAADGAGVPGTAAAEGDRVRLTLEGPGTPFERVELEAKVRGASVVVRLTQSFGAAFSHRDAVGLSTPADFGALLAALEADGLSTLPAAPRAPAGVTAATRYRIEVVSRGRTRLLTIANPERLTDRRYLGLVRRIRSWVVAITGAPAFVDGRLSAEDSGFLHLETNPPGRVFLNDVLLAESTPVDALRLPLGEHALRVVATDGKLERRLDITIEKGKTTSLRMNLE